MQKSFEGCLVAEVLVQSLGVEVVDVVVDFGGCSLPCGECDPVQTFRFQLGEERFRDRVVPTFEPGSHGTPYAELAAFDRWRLAQGFDPNRCFALSAHALCPYTAAAFQPNDCLLFGNESRGLPAESLARFADRALHIPMPARAVRSLNLANAVGIVLYEALRHLHIW